MRSVVEIDIEAPQERVAELFCDPANNPKWMNDLERYEPISGEQGAPGSKFRLVTERMTFVATVIARRLPECVELVLDSKGVAVAIEVSFSTLPSGGTRLVSAEEFRFKGLARKAMSILARKGIATAHRGQMEAFKRFAEAS
jgi:hypothetical protein